MFPIPPDPYEECLSLPLGEAPCVDPRFRIRRLANAEFDGVTAREMDFPGYWCPHNADFLNWRYLDHPLETYTAFVLSENDVPVGYSVLRIAGERATRSEFAVASRPFGPEWVATFGAWELKLVSRHGADS